MIAGILGAFFWAMETVLLTSALKQTAAVQMEPITASLAAAAWHDTISALYLLAFLTIRGLHRQIIPAVQSPGGKKILLAALLGGPAGMTCYMMALHYAGASLTTSVSAVYPAIGALLSLLVLKEHLKRYQMIGIFASAAGTALLGLETGEEIVTRFGFLFALLCAVSWGSEAVISSVGMEQSGISSELAIQLRQMTSSVVYLLFVVPVFHIETQVKLIFGSISFRFLLLAALFGTVSYLCYYQAIRQIGSSKAMALNITYTVWVIIVESIWQMSVPALQTIFCAILISIGSVFSVYEKYSKE